LGIIFLTLLTTYFLATLLLKAPFFQIKDYRVYGITEKEFPIIKEKIHSLGRALTLLPEEKLLKEFNEIAGNRFREVRVRKHFSQEGISVELEFVRREAYARVRTGRRELLVDEEGTFFEDEQQRPERVLKTPSLDVVQEYWPLLKEVLSIGQVVSLGRGSTVVRVGTRKYILPPPSQLTPRNLKALRYAVKKGFEGKEIDLRYKSFILLR